MGLIIEEISIAPQWPHHAWRCLHRTVMPRIEHSAVDALGAANRGVPACAPPPPVRLI